MADAAKDAHSDDSAPNREDANTEHADQETGDAGTGLDIDAIDDAEAWLAAAEQAGEMPPDPDDADDGGKPVDVDSLPTEDEHDFPELVKEEGEDDEPPPSDTGEEEQPEPDGDGGDDDDGDDGDDAGKAGKDDGDEDGKKPPQFRFRPKNELEERAFWFMRRNADLSIEEAVAKAKAELNPGDKDDSDDGKGDEDRDSAPQTREELESAIKAAREEKRNALAEFDYEKVAEIEERLDSLIDQREPLRERELASQHQAQEAFRRDLAEVNALYPDAANPDSEFYQRMREYDQHLRETDDPQFYDPQKASRIAKQVAAELGVLPVLPGKTPAKKPVTATPAPPSRRQAAPRPASGSARTTGGPSATEAQIDQLSDPDEFMEFVGAGY